VTPQEAIEAAELMEAEAAYRNQAAREMTASAAAAGYERGLAEGYMLAVADFKAFQHAEVRDAELETLRWGPEGRAHFGDPRPGDYPGRHPGSEPEAEPELEIA
jgi:hypothetical protein